MRYKKQRNDYQSFSSFDMKRLGQLGSFIKKVLAASFSMDSVSRACKSSWAWRPHEVQRSSGKEGRLNLESICHQTGLIHTANLKERDAWLLQPRKNQPPLK
jgi:hypothetical protein